MKKNKLVKKIGKWNQENYSNYQLTGSQFRLVILDLNLRKIRWEMTILKKKPVQKDIAFSIKLDKTNNYLVVM